MESSGGWIVAQSLPCPEGRRLAIRNLRFFTLLTDELPPINQGQSSRGEGQIRSVAQSCPILCDPMNCSTPGLPVLHHLPEFAQIHVHWVSDAIQPSHPLSSPSPTALNLFQNQGLFQWAGSSHYMAKVLELQLQLLFISPLSYYVVLLSPKCLGL